MLAKYHKRTFDLDDFANPSERWYLASNLSIKHKSLRLNFVYPIRRCINKNFVVSEYTAAVKLKFISLLKFMALAGL